MKHNYVENNPHLGYSHNGAYLEISYNETRNVCTRALDCGALYSGAHWEYSGNVIKCNFFHDSTGFGQPLSYVIGIYLDDNLSKQTVYQNVVSNFVGYCIVHGSGRSDVIYNNIFYKCDIGYSGDSRGPRRYHTTPNAFYNLLDTMVHSGVDRYISPWKDQFPEWALLPKTSEELMKEENVHWLCMENSEIYCNVFYNHKRDYAFEEHCDKYMKRWEMNTNSTQDPMFYDVDNNDFKMKKEGEIYKYNCWEEIFYENIGINTQDNAQSVVVKGLIYLWLVLCSF
ncbi:hypothetical protein EIN_473200 [Entamoeba invadens IP1]|uniref:Right handed beta helix domain-containing protein n=1 Tax=Entamoeba invadens IP1 TaxID=370355 RepID=A0A0A1U9V8_ENTIV|nr:hypothetical protein EIN_473200 [Entamoeba invadens IP1]ELP89912.1 hypothetical protein EIN_473200 [Entamoeba invadens IP1]|eukprot:XP_004256683.1 hypothetical protein EIN_473200 [Entamoeba invadens IP1]